MSAFDRGVRLLSASDGDALASVPARPRWLPAWAFPGLVAMLLDAAAISGTSWMVATARGDAWTGPGEALVRVAALAGLVVILLGAGMRAYGRTALLAPPFASLLKLWGMGLLLVCAPAYLVLPLGTLPSEAIVLLGVLAPAALLAGREALALLLALAFRRDWLSRRSIVVLARTRSEADGLARRLRRDADCRQARAAALFECEPTDLAGADLVVIQAGGIRREDVGAALEALRAMPGAAQFVAAAPLPQRLRPLPESLGDCAIFARKRAPLTRAERLAKRGLDVAVSGVALALLAPLLCALPLALWLREGRPVLAIRRMRGFDGRAITVPGFVPPRSAAGAPGAWESLRELPSLAAVLAGRLSLVGPAALPDQPGDADLAVARYAARQGLRPGLCRAGEIASVSPGRAEDLAYCDQWSLGLDLAVLARQLAGLCVEPARQAR